MSGHTRWCQGRCGVVARWRCQIGTVESNGGTYTAAFPSAPGGLAQRLVRRYEDAPGAGRTPDTQLDCRGSPLTPANLAAASLPDNTHYTSGTPSEPRSRCQRVPTFPARRRGPPRQADGHDRLRSEYSSHSERTPSAGSDWPRRETGTPSAPWRSARVHRWQVESPRGVPTPRPLRLPPAHGQGSSRRRAAPGAPTRRPS
jgi:hypothetical protein